MNCKIAWLEIMVNLELIKRKYSVIYSQKRNCFLQIGKKVIKQLVIEMGYSPSEQECGEKEEATKLWKEISLPTARWRVGGRFKKTRRNLQQINLVSGIGSVNTTAAYSTRFKNVIACVCVSVCVLIKRLKTQHFNPEVELNLSKVTRDRPGHLSWWASGNKRNL